MAAVPAEGSPRHEAMVDRPPRTLELPHNESQPSLPHTAPPVTLPAMSRAPDTVEGLGQVLGQPVRHPSAWTAADMRQRQAEWVYPLTAEDVAELEAAAAAATGKAIQDVTLDDFPLPALGPKLRALLREVTHGRGFQLLSGVPVERWSREQTMLAYWGMGLYWGSVRSINKQGHLVGHIKDIGHDPNRPETRLYATAAAQPIHNDGPADVVTLLCLHPAKEGGASHWTSSTSVYNEILRRRPDLLDVLAGPWYFDRKGEVPRGKQPFFEIPVLNFHKGYLSVNFSSNYYILSQRHKEVPRLTPAHLEAIKVFEEIAWSDELRLDWNLRPGEIQLLSNHTCLHSREGFVDDPQDATKQRHLLRLWLSPEEERPLPDAYKEIMGGSLEPGKRGGIVTDGTTFHIPLHAHEQ